MIRIRSIRSDMYVRIILWFPLKWSCPIKNWVRCDSIWLNTRLQCNLGKKRGQMRQHLTQYEIAMQSRQKTWSDATASDSIRDCNEILAKTWSDGISSDSIQNCSANFAKALWLAANISCFIWSLWREWLLVLVCFFTETDSQRKILKKENEEKMRKYRKIFINCMTHHNHCHWK